MSAGCVEEIQQGDLIVECLLQRPTVLAVRRACQRIARLQHRRLGQRITGIHGSQWIARKYIAMTIEDERSVPVRRNFNQVVGSPDIPGEYIGRAGYNTLSRNLGRACFSVRCWREGHRQATQQSEQRNQEDQPAFHDLKTSFLYKGSQQTTVSHW